MSSPANFEGRYLFHGASRSSPQEFISQIAIAFHSSNWGFLCSMLNRVGFHMDIIAALPLELAMEVLKYLSPFETIQLRVVSKCYYYLLKSEEVCSFLSHRFTTPEYNLSKIQCSWRLHYENNVMRWRSFATGRSWRIETVGEIDETGLKVFSTETLCLAVTSNAGAYVTLNDFSLYPAKCILRPTGARTDRVSCMRLYSRALRLW